jgi:hypothetical protein
MPHTAIVTFTARPVEWILRDGGSGDWRLDPERARHAEFLVCTQNRHNAEFGAPTAPHGHAFLIGRIAGVGPSRERPDRWVIKISEYMEPNIGRKIWGYSGHARYPIRYTTLEELGIDLRSQPPFRPVPALDGGGGMHEVASPLVVPAEWQLGNASGGVPLRDHGNDRGLAGGPDAWRRLDAILDQIDRIPDLPAPFDPLDWDEQGLPR